MGMIASFMIGGVIGMILTAIVAVSESGRYKGKKLCNYDDMMEQINEYWEDCKRDCKSDWNCELCNKLCFESIIGIIISSSRSEP